MYAWCSGGGGGGVLSGQNILCFSEINIDEYLTVDTIDIVELRLTNIWGSESRGRQCESCGRDSKWPVRLCRSPDCSYILKINAAFFFPGMQITA